MTISLAHPWRRRLPAIAAVLAAVPTAEAQRWAPIGPSPISGEFQGGSAGRVSSIAVDPANANHWLVAAPIGGVWETVDAGATWLPITEDQPTQAMGVVAFAPSDSAIIYAGTGDRVASRGTYPGAGLLKSKDGGVQWQLLAAGTFAGSAFSDLAVDPGNPDVLVATTTTSGTRYDPGSPLSVPPVPPRGIFKSIDGGQNWAQKGPAVAENALGFPIGDGSDLAVDPGNFTRMYAGIGNSVPGSTSGVYRSLNAGDTWTSIDGPWTALAGGIGRIALAIAPSNSNVLYVSMQDNYNGAGLDGALLGL